MEPSGASSGIACARTSRRPTSTAVVAWIEATIIDGSSKFGSTAAPVPARHGLRETG